MRALVIDDEQLVLEGLEAFLQASKPDLSLDKTADPDTAVALASNFPYRLILLDWHLVGPGGRRIDTRQVVRALRAGAPGCPILVVSGDDPRDWPQLLFELGLAGFVPKSASGTTLLDAIEVALRGGVFLPDQAVAARAREAAFSEGPPDTPIDPRARFPELTERQAQVLGVMLRGASDKQIARELGIAEATVKSHVRTILAVVGVRRRGEAVFELVGRPAPHG